MDDKLHRMLRNLVRNRTVAALGTVHKNEPFVSMVPYVLHGDAAEFLIHVSLLSAHTRHMLEHSRVSLMVTAAENAVDESGELIEAQALPRVTVQGNAMRLDPEGANYANGKALYLARFPSAAQMFDLPDFSLFAISPQSVRFIAGFGKAHTLSDEQWARAIGSG
ncbi:MAG: HugZ family protein [Burkholderiales bacterium]